MVTIHRKNHILAGAKGMNLEYGKHSKHEECRNKESIDMELEKT